MSMFNSEVRTTVLTEEEKQNPELIKKNELYGKSPISVYYGSAKEGIVDTCLTCKKQKSCKEHREVVYRAIMLKNYSKDPKYTVGFTEEEAVKLQNNVFIVINCINKEEE